LGKISEVSIIESEGALLLVQTEKWNKIKTRIFRVSEGNLDAVLEDSAAIIRSGGTVAFPTETVYGLGADGLNQYAVRNIFEAKERPSGNPLSLLVHSRGDLEKIARNIPEKAFRLMDAFWPGPLTIILEKKDIVPGITSGYLPSIGIRMPNHMIPLELITRAGTPLAAPSANLSGKPSSILAAHVIDDLAGRINAIIDGGVAAIGLESTVIDMTAEAPIVLRPGAVGIKELEKIIGKISYGYKNDNVRIDEASLKKQVSQRYGHYIPNTKVILVEGESESVSKKIIELLENYRDNGQKIGFLLSKETAGIFALKELDIEEFFLLGSRKETEIAARKFFVGIRDLDKKGLDIIIVDGSFSHSGLGGALINRMREASSSSFTV